MPKEEIDELHKDLDYFALFSLVIIYEHTAAVFCKVHESWR